LESQRAGHGILIGKAEKHPRRPEGIRHHEAWTVIGWMGIAFLVMGGADISLAVRVMSIAMFTTAFALSLLGVFYLLVIPVALKAVD
jgi:hypothetical protein